MGDEQEAREWLRNFDETGGKGLDRLERFAALLTAESRQQNLISTSTLPMLWRRHIADSAQLLIGVSREVETWLDIGSGAGLPGVVIAALRPELRVTLVEPRAGRVKWLTRACHELELVNTRVVGTPLARLETSLYSVISARAVASLADLARMAERFSTAKTLWRLPKGRSAQEELQNLTGWEHTFHVEQSLTDRNAGIITGHLLGRTARVRS